ncbi:MAG: aminotransferase class I/II-fold pyridoxal phosphate-dependent enzyme [Sphingobacteriales bacterium]|nr:MAG: aminotransferase class I/II-fold pyridoxal phosphate-dependent enzyme [Sphingobacteriales bacterium]
MGPYSQLAENLVGSEIVRLGNIIADRVRNGESIFNFTIGDFNPRLFPIPEGLKTAIEQAYEEGYTNYPSADGILPLREAVSSFVQKHYHVDYAPNEIQIASGGRPLIYSVFRSLVDPGDRVVYAVPSWNNNHYTFMNGGEHSVVETTAETAFMPTAGTLQPHLKGATLLCLCTPQNPTGTTLGRTELEAICDLVLAENARRPEGAKKLHVLFDQMYGVLTYGDTVHYNPVEVRPEMKDYTVFIDGISKCFAATGVRVGWALGPAPLIAKIKALLTHIGAWAPMAEQVATARYLVQEAAVESYLDCLKTGLHERLQQMYDGIQQLKSKGHPVDAIHPQGGLYLTAKFDLSGRSADGPQSQAAVTDYLLNEAKLAVTPFYAFGASRNDPWYRISVGTCDLKTLPQMFSQLEAALEKLR